MSSGRLWLRIILGALTLCVLGFVPIAQMSLRSGKMLLWEVSVWGMLAFFVRSRWLRWWLLWALVGYLTCYNRLSFLSMMVFGLSVVLIEVVAQRIDLSQLDRLVRGLRIIALVQLAWMGLQWVGWDPLFADIHPASRPILTGFLDNSGLAGGFLVMTAPLFAIGRWRWVLPWYGLAAFGTHSAGAVIGLMVMTGLSLWKFKALSWWIIALAVGLCVVYSVREESLIPKVRYELTHRGGRLDVWRETVRLSFIKPVMVVKGWGLGQFTPVFRGITKREGWPSWARWDRAHNEYVEVFSEQGIIGLVLACGFVWSVLGVAWGSHDVLIHHLALCAIGWLVVAGYYFPGHLGSFGMVGIVLVGALEAHRRSRSHG